MIKSLILVLFASVFTENCVLVRTLGLCPIINQNKKFEYVSKIGTLTTLIMLLSSVIIWPIYKYILISKNLLCLQTLICPLIVVLLIELTNVLLKKNKLFLNCLPALSINCLILAVPLINISNSILNPEFGLPLLITYSLGSGIGFVLVSLVFNSILDRIDLNAIPQPFRGVPIRLVVASILSLSFIGISNLIRF